MMDDTDLAGPLLFCFVFGMLLLLAGKSQFGYVYGVGLMGVISIYFLLNLMSEGGIDASRVTSVLGYCLLPLCLLSALNVFVRLKYVPKLTQRRVRLHCVAPVYSMVQYRRVRHLCLGLADAQPTLPGRVPRGALLCMLRDAECI